MLIDSAYVGCIFYADDILLLSASVDVLQKMLSICTNCGYDLGFVLISLNPYA